MPALRPVHFELAASCLAEIQRGKRPADAILREAFKARPQMGSKDRAGVSDLVYGVLRDYRRLEAFVGADPAALCKAHLEGVGGRDASTLTPAQRLNLPDWLYASLVEQHGEETAAQIAQALNQPATIDLRVNTLRATRDQARDRLGVDGLKAENTPLSPTGLRLPRRAPLQAAKAFLEGLIEPQDEGSQLLALLADPQPGQKVVDYCAGAGGKTLALGALMRNQGRLYALDSAAKRLERLAPRAQRAGVTIVESRVLSRSPYPHELFGDADVVLVDAPCSSSGALRRNPELRLREVALDQLAAIQKRILASAAELVAPGGVLVYATCSLAREENEAVVRDFLADHAAFAMENAGEILRRHGVAYEGQLLKLLPHRHGTDGFFGARLRRRS
jgi:16S rRNA (cytosine967-C5)-methyltransferase